MILKIYQTGKPILRKKAKPVSKTVLAKAQTQNLIDLMVGTLRDAPGFGLAAPQVGESLRIFIVEDKAEYHEILSKEVLSSQNRKPLGLKVFVNPELVIEEYEEAFFFEGCLSVEGYLAVVPRAKKVKIKALDRYGKAISYEAEGWFARILQHEVGHLNGELYVDKMLSESFVSQKNFNTMWRKSVEIDIKKAFVA